MQLAAAPFSHEGAGSGGAATGESSAEISAPEAMSEKKKRRRGRAKRQPNLRRDFKTESTFLDRVWDSYEFDD